MIRVSYQCAEGDQTTVDIKWHRTIKNINQSFDVIISYMYLDLAAHASYLQLYPYVYSLRFKKFGKFRSEICSNQAKYNLLI